MNPQQIKDVIQGISRTFQGLRLYSIQHPAIKQHVQDWLAALSKLFLEKKTLRMGLLDGTLFFEEELFAYPSPAEEEIARLLRQLQIEGLEFVSGLTNEELLAFLNIAAKGEICGDALEEAFAGQGIRHIRTIRIQYEEEKPGEPRKIYQRAIKVMETLFADVRLGQIPSSLEAKEVVKEMVELTLADPHALFALTMLKDYDNYTFTHSVNVSVISLAAGRACELSEEQLHNLGLGGMFHDLGKLKIDLQIITKPGKLTEQEFESIKTHPRNGADIVDKMEGIPQAVKDIVLGHHLRFDRAGYPADARSHRLSPLTDIVSIADAYDAMTTLRSYQRPITPRLAIKELRKMSGTSLHPHFLERFISSLGPYPVGSLVRLDNNEIALVVQVDISDPGNAEFKILFDGDGRLLTEPRPLKLGSTEAVRIVGEVDPFLKGIEVASYFP
jgi:HD-GYP domain-containing protein (c-di-GMP phosphodiesterase class II)